MHFKYVRWRNFNSYGYNMQTINFDELESQLFLLLGQNGTGKCLNKNTKINIKIDNIEIKKKFLEYLKNK